MENAFLRNSDNLNGNNYDKTANKHCSRLYTIIRAL